MPFRLSMGILPFWKELIGFAGGSDRKEFACNVGDLGSIPGLGGTPGGGHGNRLQYSCLENPHEQRSLAGCSRWGHKELDTTEQLNAHIGTDIQILAVGIWPGCSERLLFSVLSLCYFKVIRRIEVVLLIHFLLRFVCCLCSSCLNQKFTFFPIKVHFTTAQWPVECVFRVVCIWSKHRFIITWLCSLIWSYLKLIPCLLWMLDQSDGKEELWVQRAKYVPIHELLLLLLSRFSHVRLCATP